MLLPRVRIRLVAILTDQIEPVAIDHLQRPTLRALLDHLRVAGVVVAVDQEPAGLGSTAEGRDALLHPVAVAVVDNVDDGAVGTLTAHEAVAPVVVVGQGEDRLTGAARFSGVAVGIVAMRVEPVVRRITLGAVPQRR